MTHLHASLRYNRDVDDVARAARDLMRGRSTATFTEARRFRAALQRPGFRLVHHKGTQGQPECALLVAESDFLRDLGPIRLSDVPIPRRSGWLNYAVGADTTRGKILGVHMPSGVEGAKGFSDDNPGQVKAYKAQIEALADQDADEIWADWNLDARLPWVRAYFARQFPDHVIVAPAGATHKGGRTIDWGLVRRGSGTWAAKAVANPASDHRAVVATHAPAPPKEAPVTYFSRSQWGARAPRARYDFGGSDVRGVALHWPAMSKPVRGVAAVSAALRNWQDYHMDTQRWSDIGYQEAVDQDGNAYELRGLSHKSGANGNDSLNDAYGAILLVLAPGEQPTEAMMRTTRARIAEHRRRHPSSRSIVGHGQIRPGGTQCPGPIAQRLIHEGAFEPSAAPAPKPAPTPTPEELDMTPENEQKIRQIIREEIDAAFRGDERKVLDLGRARVEDPDDGTGLTLARWLKSTRDDVRAVLKHLKEQ